MGNVRQKIKKKLPKNILYHYYLRSAKKIVLPDLKRRVKDKIYSDSKEELLKRDLTIAYHIVEKGLTMPETRLGFGRDVVISLINTVLEYNRMSLPEQELEFKQSVSVLKEYKEFHDQHKFELDSELSTLLEKIESKFPSVEGMKQIRVSREEYFQDIDKPFDQFCFSRYSVRNYSNQDVPDDVLLECIDIAQKSPSFCNRQPTRVHIVKSQEKRERILSLQNGNRGFGHLANTLLVITSIISTTKSIIERNENHLNGGLFTMTLLYGLHQKKIAACPLNWSVSNDKEDKMREVLSLDDNEIPILVISCGYLPEEISIASSPRKTAQEITKSH